MKLMTKAIEEVLPTLDESAEWGLDKMTAQVKYFLPDGAATWYIAAYEPETRLAFGQCDLGLGFPELGYVSLDELETVRGAFGMPVERDMWFIPTPLAEIVEKAA